MIILILYKDFIILTSSFVVFQELKQDFIRKKKLLFIIQIEKIFIVTSYLSVANEIIPRYKEKNQ